MWRAHQASTAGEQSSQSDEGPGCCRRSHLCVYVYLAVLCYHDRLQLSAGLMQWVQCKLLPPALLAEHASMPAVALVPIAPHREPVRTVVRDCYSFCQFDVLWARAAGEEAHSSGSGDSDDGDSGAAQQQLAEAFVQAVLGDDPTSQGADTAADPAASQSTQQHAHSQLCNGGRQDLASSEQREIPSTTSQLPTATKAARDAAGGAPPCTPAAVAAAIWALHPCKQASASQPPALLAIPGADERTAEVVCAACGQLLAEFREAAAGRKLGMLMALQLFCAAPAGTNPEGAAAAPGAATPAKDPAGALEPGSTMPQCAAAGPGCGADAAPATAPPSSPPRIILAAGYEDGSVAVWHVGAAPGAPPLAQRQLCSEPVMALAIDGAAAGGAAGSAEEQVVVFRLDLTACPARLSVRHTMEVSGKGKAGFGDVAVRPDNRLLATAGWDGRVRLFKYRSGRPLAVLKVGERAGQLTRTFYLGLLRERKVSALSLEMQAKNWS